MNSKYSLLFVLILIFISCKNENHITRIEGKQISISDSFQDNAEIEKFIRPFREHVIKDLDSVIAYAVDTYSKTDGHLNTAIGNLMVDAVHEQANPVFKSRTGKDIDMVLLNHGGIRSIISKGPITPRTAFQLMPFENNVVVAELKGKFVKDLVIYLQNARRAHPISNLKIIVDKDFGLIEAKINAAEIIDDKTYYIATSDYLYGGGDRITFFQNSDSLHVLDYKIRNVLIDYFKKVDTINPTIDDRFIQIN